MDPSGNDPAVARSAGSVCFPNRYLGLTPRLYADTRSAGSHGVTLAMLVIRPLTYNFNLITTTLRKSFCGNVRCLSSKAPN